MLKTTEWPKEYSHVKINTKYSESVDTNNQQEYVKCINVYLEFVKLLQIPLD